MDKETYSHYLERLQRIAENIKAKQPWYKKLGIGLNQDDRESEHPEVFANRVLSDALMMTVNDVMRKQPQPDYWDDGLVAKGTAGLGLRVDTPVTAESKKVIKALSPSLLSKKPFTAYFDAKYKLLNDPSSKQKLTEDALKRAVLMVDYNNKRTYSAYDDELYKGGVN